jgi:hypothetical protein
MATKAELAIKVVQHLGLLQAGQLINSNDSTLVQDAYDSVYLLLQDNHSVDWGPDDDIPQEFELDVRDIVAFRVAKTFGVTPDAVEFALANKNLKKALAVDDSNEPARTQQF